MKERKTVYYLITQDAERIPYLKTYFDRHEDVSFRFDNMRPKRDKSDDEIQLCDC